jgi:hypothetical protein
MQSPESCLHSFLLSWLFLLGLGVGRGGSHGVGFGRVILESAFGDFVTAFATEETKVVNHPMLAFLLSQLATQVQHAGQVILQSGSRGLLLLSRVLLFLAFVRLFVILLAGVVVGVVVGQTRIVVVGGGGLVIGLLHFAGIVFMSKLSFLLLISCISILGLLSHELESFWLAIASGDFILKAIRKSFIKTMSEWGIAPIAVRC